MTLNEEDNLPACLESVQWSDDIVVLDSYSTDQTLEVAKQFGARVIQRRFDNWGSHQTYAFNEIPYGNRWVFYLDADERMTPDLWKELVALSRSSSDRIAAYCCGRRNIIDGKWLKRSFSPGRILRFLRPGRARFERLVHPQPVVDGKIGQLKNLLVHYPMSKGLFEFIDRHNKYSTWEAKESLKVVQGSKPRFRELFTGDAKSRHRALKRLSVFLPGRAWWRFAYMMFVKRGVLDGPVGWRYCILMTIYEYFIHLKTRELINAQNRGT